MERKTCHRCGSQVALKINGTFRKHLSSKRDESGIFRIPCEGSGQTPKENPNGTT